MTTPGPLERCKAAIAAASQTTGPLAADYVATARAAHAEGVRELRELEFTLIARERALVATAQGSLALEGGADAEG